MATTFEWPWQYSFPPFFTIQPNLDTRSKQLEAWKNLLISYYKFHKLYRLDITEALTNDLFANSTINRKLPLEGIHLVLDSMERTGNVEWENPKEKKRCYIMWRTLEEWADLIYTWVADAGLTDTVCTLYELHSGDDTVDQEFHQIDMAVLRKALQVLETRGKAQIFSAADPQEEGVKFFA